MNARIHAENTNTQTLADQEKMNAAPAEQVGHLLQLRVVVVT